MKAEIAGSEEAPAEKEFALNAARALRKAAQRLAVPPELLAARCVDGELADVIIELRLARFNLPSADQERVEGLLRSIGVLP